MPGRLSDPSREIPQASQASPPDKPAELASERHLRITNVYATPWHAAESIAHHDLPEYLTLGRLERYYRQSADQLPRVLHRAELDTACLKFTRWRDATRLTGTRIWLFRLPSGQVVTALTLDARCAFIDTIDLLEDCYYCDVLVDDEPLEQHVHAMAAGLDADGSAERTFLSERHQIVFDKDAVADGCEDLVQRMIYRADLPYRQEYSAISYPAELNRRPGWLTAVGPYVSVVCGHQGYIENSIFVSAVIQVAAAAQLRAIRHAAYADVRLFRAFESDTGGTKARRRTLELIADQLGDLELELSYSVEAAADLGLIVPSLRAEGFHHALYESIGLADKAAVAGRMLRRLGSAISAELTAIESIERRDDENRRLRYAVAVGFVSAVAIPVGLVLAFLGINARQVEVSRSMFSHHYLGIYLIVIAIMVLGTALALGLYARQRRDARQYKVTAPRARWTPVRENHQP